jgi:hypothetical protein
MGGATSAQADAAPVEGGACRENMRRKHVAFMQPVIYIEHKTQPIALYESYFRKI